MTIEEINKRLENYNRSTSIEQEKKELVDAIKSNKEAKEIAVRGFLAMGDFSSALNLLAWEINPLAYKYKPNNELTSLQNFVPNVFCSDDF